MRARANDVNRSANGCALFHVKKKNSLTVHYETSIVYLENECITFLLKTRHDKKLPLSFP